MLYFKTILLTALLFCLTVLPSHSQDYLNGVLSGTIGPGTYIVNGDCEVEGGTSLTILPGTILMHNGHHTWQIYGQLIAEGTESDSIKFIRQSPISSHRWGGIRFTPTVLNYNSMSYCAVEYVYNGVNILGGGVYIVGNQLILQNSRISNCEVEEDGAGLYAYYASMLLVENCVFSYNEADIGGGVYVNMSHGAQVKYCEIVHNICNGT